MKIKSINRLMAVLITATVIFGACKKEDSDVRLAPTLATAELLNVTSNAATVVGYVVAQGDGFTEKGICYNISATPTVDNTKVVYSGETKTASFNVTLTGLKFATKYYARAYAIGTAGTIYGEEYNFTTLPVVPILTTTAATSITGNSVSTGGNITGNGGAEVIARGVAYGIEHNPTVAGTKTSDDKGTGVFVSTLSGLLGNTTYYARAYATNSAGTAYGIEVSFTTLVDLPVVTTTAVTAITKVSANSGGNVTYDGGGAITARGLAWGINPDPTTADGKIDGGTGTGAFVSNLAGLTLNTTYHVRAYATNSAGTAYGPDVQFSTLADITKLWAVGDYNGWDNSNNAKYIISTATSNGDAEGYVFLKSGGFKLVTDHTWSDAATFGDDGGGKLTNPGSNIPVPADGYYLIKANLGNKTYSITNTVWGIIGDATVGDWADQTNMVYDPTTLTFSLTTHLVAEKAFKFRGTSDWGVNYGSDNADGKLNAGGGNIPVTITADYTIVLDLSHPNVYTYTTTTWGLIGSATADTWNSDQNMTWDPVAKVWTLTTDLTVGEIKFRANDAWDLNYGGDINALSAGGANIAIAEAGNYTITLNVVTLKATVKKN